MKRATLPQSRLDAVKAAILALKTARGWLAYADAPESLKKVRSALKSAEGAERHAYGRIIRDQLDRPDSMRLEPPRRTR